MFFRVIFALVFTLMAHASIPALAQAGECLGLFSDGNASDAAFVPWSPQKWDLQLTPDQIVGADYRRKIEELTGQSLKLQIEEHPLLRGSESKVPFDVSARILKISLGDKTFLQSTFFTVGEDTQTLYVGELRIENPFPSDRALRLRPGQLQKGMPYAVFSFAQNQLKVIARAGGFREITTPFPVSYSVAMLYRRAVGMKPASPASETTYKTLDQLFSFAKHELPPSLRIRSMEEFDRLLDPDSEVFARAQTVWANPKPENLLRDSSGIVRALILDPETPSSAVLLVDSTNEILTWRKIFLVGFGAPALSHIALKAEL